MQVTKSLTLALAVMALSACKSSSDNKSQHEHTIKAITNDTGRLLVTSDEDANPRVAILNLQDNSVIDTFALNQKASAAYSSPKNRYALIAQRDNGLVQIVDGGLYQEDHGDHLHPYQKKPKLLNKDYKGAKPTHYRIHKQRAAFFFDGDSTQAVFSKIKEFTDAAIANDEEREISLTNNMHGTIEPLDKYLLTTKREATTGSPLPNKVELYEWQTNAYKLKQTFSTSCPKLHGSYSTITASVFGCSDGVLLITRSGDNFTASKINNPTDMEANARIGGFSGHVNHHLIASWAKGSLYMLDTKNKTLSKKDWTNGDVSAIRSSSLMDDEGKELMVLDKTGRLHFLDANTFAYKSNLKVLDKMPELKGHARVSIAQNPKNDLLYIVDKVNSKVKVLNLSTKKIEKTFATPFKPNHLVWLGISDKPEDNI